MADRVILAPPSWLVGGLFGLGFLGFVGALRGYLRGVPHGGYDAGGAWLRAGGYFSACWALAAFSGALPTILGNPLVSAAEAHDPGWILTSGGLMALVVFGYWVVWPLGTLTYGRRLILPDTLIFGLLWGLSEGLVFASVWVTAARLLGIRGASGVAVTAITVLALSTFIGFWHAKFWDVKVAPEHNIPAWNLRKVLLVHVPNVTLTTAYVTATGSLGVWVVMQTVALVGSALFMRFPSVRRLRPRQ